MLTDVVRAVYAERVHLTRPGHPTQRFPAGLRASIAAVWLHAAACAGQAVVPHLALLSPAEISQPRQAQAVRAGTITGQVLSSDGAVISGAHIAFAAQDTTSMSTSDADGRFVLPNLPPGPFTLSITLSGFSPVTETGVVQPGQTLEMPPSILSLAVVRITVEAVTPEQLALEEVHLEEHQRLAGVLPNFFVSYNWTAPPLTPRQKFTLATHNAADPGNLALVGTVAGVQQAANAFPGYHQGARGYGRRYGADLANLVVGTYMGGAVLPTLLRQDPRYFYKGNGTTRSRAFYAISRAVITRGDNGRDQPNVSGVLGDLSAAALSNLYYPASDRQGATLFFENGILAVAGDAMNNLFQEFVFNRITTKGKKQPPHP